MDPTQSDPSDTLIAGPSTTIPDAPTPDTIVSDEAYAELLQKARKKADHDQVREWQQTIQAYVEGVGGPRPTILD